MAVTHRDAQQDDLTPGWFEKFIYPWFVLAGALGLLLGKLVPRVTASLDSISWAGVSLPLVVVMFFVMLPPRARIKSITKLSLTWPS